MWNRKTHLRNIFQYIIIKIIQKSASSKSSSWALVGQFKMFNARLSPNSYLRTICANVEQKVKLTIRYRLRLTTTPRTVDGRIIQTLIHRATPLTPNINVIFLFGSFLRMDEINQTPRAGTALRNHWNRVGKTQIQSRGGTRTTRRRKRTTTRTRTSTKTGGGL